MCGAPLSLFSLSISPTRLPPLFSYLPSTLPSSLILLSSFYSPILPYSPIFLSLSHPPSSFPSSSRPPSRAQEKRQTEKTHKRLPHVDEDKNDVMRGGLLSKTIDHISVLIEDWFTGTEFPWSHSQPRIYLVSFPALPTIQFWMVGRAG